MGKRKQAASISRSEIAADALRDNPASTAEYIDSALQRLDDPNHRAGALLALRRMPALLGRYCIARFHRRVIPRSKHC